MSEQAMNKLELIHAQAEERRLARAREHEARNAAILEARAQRDALIATGQPIPAAPTLHEIFTASRSKQQEELRQRRREVITGQYALNPHAIAFTPQALEDWRRDYFAKQEEEA